MKHFKKLILEENKKILSSFNESQEDGFLDLLENAYKNKRKVLCYGAGRMGLALKAFSMRLNHLGINSYYFGDNYIPPLNEADFVVLASNSGETTTVVSVAEAALKKARSTIISFVGNPESTLASLSSFIVTFKTCNGGLNSSDDKSKFNSKQPMTSLTEQALYLEFDAIVLALIDRLKINLDDTKIYHSNVE